MDKEDVGERALVQLAGCLTAAEGFISGDNRAKPDQYGWSPAYQAVLELREAFEKLAPGCSPKDVLNNCPRIITLTEGVKDHWTIREYKGESIYPPITKPTSRETVARVAQVMGEKEPIKPQDWPERIQVGSVDFDNCCPKCGGKASIVHPGIFPDFLSCEDPDCGWTERDV